MEHSGVCEHKATVFPRADIPANTLQGQTVQQSEKLQNQMKNLNISDSTGHS